jgi:hypothetical protein
VSDLRGASRLIIDAVLGITNIVESMHRNIAGLAPIMGTAKEGPTRGITGFVYGSVRGATRGVGAGLDVALAQLAPLLQKPVSGPRRENLLAALNGVFGDYLEANTNPLAIQMQLRSQGRPLLLDPAAMAAQFQNPKPHLVVMVHGLCMNDLLWQRAGHDHGLRLAEALGATPLYLNYNSGRHISTNGREFADLLNQLLATWPVPVREISIIGHSMGGLVSRSACHYAAQAGHSWLLHLTHLMTLGTPHHGAPLERAGSWVDLLLGLSPYSAPLAKLGTIRSAGVKDLRHGSLIDQDWQRPHPPSTRDRRTPVPLPAGVSCFAIAASTQQPPGRAGRLPRGDGLVAVASALGKHSHAAHALAFAPAHQHICYGTNHLDLLSSQEAFAVMLAWLSDIRPS